MWYENVVVSLDNVEGHCVVVVAVGCTHHKMAVLGC